MDKNNEVNVGNVEPQLTAIRSLCVYCGSWSGTEPTLEEFARTFGSACAARGIELIYGGGGIGLMGTVAEAALDGRRTSHRHHPALATGIGAAVLEL